MIIAKDKQFLGVVTLYRNIGKDDFNHDEVFLVDTLKDAYGISSVAAETEPYTVW